MFYFFILLRLGLWHEILKAVRVHSEVLQSQNN
jgi:hypothetical protein